MKNRFTIRITGESGQGINSIGEILLKAFKNEHFYVFGYREYPSLIKGGDAAYQINISDKPISSNTQRSDLMVSISRYSLHKYLPNMKRGGLIIHNIDRLKFDKDEKKFIEDNEISFEYINATQQSILSGGNKLTTNVFLTGHVWCKLRLNYQSLEKEILKRYGKDERYREMNRKVLSAGCEYNTQQSKYKLNPSQTDLSKFATMTGNDALSLGAISAGCTHYFAYPMTPASSILTTLSKFSKEADINVRQVEDEISAVQMVLGSNFAGSRAFTSTSGGGFDLMTESISMSGMTEIPLVLVLAQRPGPATGLPTWSSSSDLNIALYGGHGEFPRIVLSASDAISSYTQIQKAFNLSEKYQLPVILLTEKDIAESIFMVDELPQSKKIIRAFDRTPDENSHRYEFTQTGVSPRWLPGSSKETYITNSDEHDMDGNSTEDSETAIAMMEKRMRKLKFAKEDMEEPVRHGPKIADISLVGWGSVKGVILDLLDFVNDRGAFTINYLHFDDIFPLRTENLVQFLDHANLSILVENNSTMQFGKLVRAESGLQFDRYYNKYDGRPIYFEEIFTYLSLLKI